MGLRVASALLLSAFALASCKGGRDSKDGGGKGGSGGRGAADSGKAAGRGGTTSDGGGGAGSSVVSPVRCGSARCTATGTFAACCVDAASGTCGVEDKLIGISCGVPAVADPRCPMVKVDLAGSAIMFEGCCSADGFCGGFNLGSPCAVVAIADDDGGVTLRRRQKCN